MAEYDEEFESSAHEQRKMAARDEHKGKKLFDLVTAMHQYKQEKEVLESALKLVNAHFDVLREELVPERMDTDGVKTVVYDGIGRVSQTADIRVALPTGNKPDLFKWFRARKLGSLIVEGINSSTLKSFVKQRMKDGKEIPNELLSVTPFVRASITKVGAKN